MAKTDRTTIIFAILVFAAITAYAVLRTTVFDAQIPIVGDEATDFRIPGLDGKEVHLAALRGNVVFVNFWATWCPPCRDEMPSLQSLAHRFRGRPFQMVAVSVDGEGRSIVRKFLEKGRYDIPVFLDPGGKLAFDYGVVKYPETIVIGAEGKVREKFIGPFDWMDEKLVAKIEALIVEAERGAGMVDETDKELGH